MKVTSDAVIAVTICAPGIVEDAEFTELLHEGGWAENCSTATKTVFNPLTLM